LETPYEGVWGESFPPAGFGALPQKILLFILIFILLLSLTACAGTPSGLYVPLPPQGVEQSKKEAPELSYAEDSDRQYMAVNMPVGLADGPRQGEPQELAELLELRGWPGEDSAVSLLRPLAIREAAQLVTLQTAISWRYRQLLEATEVHAAILDTAFNFSPLLLTQGAALVMPPVLTRAGASMRIEKPDTATSALASYELMEAAKFVPFAPHWREFLMSGSFPAPEKPSPALMPRNSKERDIWRAAVREAWAQGLTEADQLYADNVARMARQYRGVMLYHLLTAQHLLSKVTTASAKVVLNSSDTMLYIGQEVYRITAPSRFSRGRK
jgi:hypothetical protein